MKANVPLLEHDLHCCPENHEQTHGINLIQTQQSRVLIFGKAIACENDLIFCLDGSIAQIINCQACVTINGLRIACNNDKSTHNGTFIPSTHSVQITMGNPFIYFDTNIFIETDLQLG